MKLEAMSPSSHDLLVFISLDAFYHGLNHLSVWGHTVDCHRFLYKWMEVMGSLIKSTYGTHFEERPCAPGNAKQAEHGEGAESDLKMEKEKVPKS